MTERELFGARIALIQSFLRDGDYDGILLSRMDNFAMATGGKRNYVGTVTDMGACSLFVTRDGAAYLVGNNIEETRVVAEELGPLGCEIRKFFWFEDSAAALVSREFAGALVSDDGALGENVNGKLALLRALLTPDELEKYRRLGRLAAETITEVVEQATADMAEADISALLTAGGARRRCLVPIALVAADDRIARFRHPLPTQAPLLEGTLAECRVQGYVMIILSLLREGLVASVTRFKRVGDLPEGVAAAYPRICAVDAVMQEATEPGRTLGDVFAACTRAYAQFGFPADEWHRHHQGGATGYAGRTCKASPGEAFPILDPVWERRLKDILGMDVPLGQAFAWNPSAVGVKSEDTFILRPDGAREIVTATPQLPQVDLEAVLGRPTEVVKSGIAGA